MDNVSDGQFLTLLAEIAREIEGNVVSYNGRSCGMLDKNELIALRLQQNEELIALLTKHRRAIEFMQGKRIEPQVHFGEAVLIGVGAQE